MAVMGYLGNQPEPNSLYSLSQNMNYKMANGIALNNNETDVRDNLLSAMKPIGKNMQLTRYDHETFVNDLLTKVGVKGDYENFTDTQLKGYLKGVEYDSKSFVSTSFNDFKNAPAHNPFTNRAVKITYKAMGTSQGFTTGVGKGGDFGELLLAPSANGANHYTILDVNFTGKSARRKGTRSYDRKQINIVVGIN